LIEAGASLEIRDAAGLTPLIWAAIGGHRGTARELLKWGADPQAQVEGGFTAADYARVLGHEDVLGLLEDDE